MSGGAEAAGCLVGPRQWDVSLAPCITVSKPTTSCIPGLKERTENIKLLEENVKRILGPWTK